MGHRWARRCAAALLLALAATGLAAGQEDPHGELARADRCGECHTGGAPTPGSREPLRFQRDIVSLCLECHGDKELSSLHPVDIRPGAPVPRDLPLDDHGTITCATCHDPHGAAESVEPQVAESLSTRLLSLFTARRRYRTFFLRRRNDQGQLCLACHEREGLAAQGFHVEAESLLGKYAGSAACGACHERIFAQWQKTPHARMVRDPQRDPDAIRADFEQAPPFPREQVRYALGSHWTQRYVVEKGGKLLVKAAIWSIPGQAWDTSYWIDKPWVPYCQGCHSTGFEFRGEARHAELGVGCEACHGPGRDHVASRGARPVVNPGRLAEERRVMVCEACHTTGHDRTGQFRFPLGYLPGRDLNRYYKGLLPKPGQDNATFQGDGSAEDRHRQWRFWMGSFFDVRGLTCDICKNFRSQTAPGEKPKMTPTEYCLTCHAGDVPGDELHARHRTNEVACHRCHVPDRTADGTAYSIHDHKFLFLEPEPTRARSPREACADCHRPLAAAGGG